MNNTGQTVTIDVSYVGEQWRLGEDGGRTDRLDFQYSTDATSLTTGNWDDVNALDFTTPNTSGTAGARDGNAAANQTALSSQLTGLTLANGQSFYIRWVDLNATGADDGLAVDTFSLTASAIPGVVPLPAAVWGGSALLAGMFTAKKLRRRDSERLVD